MRCSPPRGRLRGKALGAVALARTRGRNRAALPTLVSHTRTSDRFCLSDRRHVRVGYRGGRAVAAVTTSRRYRAFGHRVGARGHGLGGRRIRVRGKTWVLRRGRSATVVLRLRRGRVAEIGLVARQGAARALRTLR